MSAASECAGCRFWLLQPQILRSDGIRIGACRRRSPRVTQGTDGRNHASFPLTREGEWCGEHKTPEALT